MTTKDLLQELLKGQRAMQNDIAQLRGEIDNVRVDLRGEIVGVQNS